MNECLVVPEREQHVLSSGGNLIFCATCTNDTLLYPQSYRLTATDELCTRRLHLQTFGPKVSPKNRKAAVYVDWC